MAKLKKRLKKNALPVEVLLETNLVEKKEIANGLTNVAQSSMATWPSMTRPISIFD